MKITICDRCEDRGNPATTISAAVGRSYSDEENHKAVKEVNLCLDCLAWLTQHLLAKLPEEQRAAAMEGK